MKNKAHNMLWTPEEGICDICKEKAEIRRLSLDGDLQNICFPCWNAAQSKQVINSKEWKDDTIYAFKDGKKPVN